MLAEDRASAETMHEKAPSLRRKPQGIGADALPKGEPSYGPAVSSRHSASSLSSGLAGGCSSLVDEAAALDEGNPFCEDSLPVPHELQRGSKSHWQLGARHDSREGVGRKRGARVS